MSEILDFEYVSLKQLMKKSDIISLHVPLNEKTKYLINKKNISQIKKGSILINTARGALIETEALIQALDKGILKGAGLDVLEGEAFLKEDRQFVYNNHPKDKLMKIIRNYNLLERENVVITPHNAFNSEEAIKRILDTTIDNIKSCFKNKCQNIVF
jgi:D-lactate dehydrogenase